MQKLKCSLLENGFILPFNVWESESGSIYILDGCHSLVAAVIGALTDNGGKVLTNIAVQKIIVENGKVRIGYGGKWAV